MMSHVTRLFSPSRPEIPMPKLKVLWIDGVGSYAMCDSDQTTIGQSFPGNDVELAIRGDLSRRALMIRRAGGDHLLQPYQPMKLDGVPLDRATILRNGSILSVGERVELRYHRPTQLSGTARLDLLPPHRWQPLLSAALLLGESCVLSADVNSHVVCPDWTSKVVLFRHQDGWMCRTTGCQNLLVGGVPTSAPFALVCGQRIQCDDFSMTLG
jgi:hypothetical protein